MTLPVELVPDATADLRDASRWDESQRAGVGAAFLERVDQALRSIADWPRSGSPIGGFPASPELRQATVRRFPYRVVYVVGEERILVYAVAHVRRRPGYWRDRVGY